MTEEQYICAHKCRGELTFSVCCLVKDMYITTCTGHRVHPFWVMPLNQLTVEPNYPSIIEAAGPMPEGLPDMFSANDQLSKTEEPEIVEIDLEELGL